MSAMDDLIAFLRDALAEDERVAREAPGPAWIQAIEREGEPGRWRGIKAELVSLPPDLPGAPFSVGATVVSSSDRRTVAHIARWDPARVLAEVDAKRKRIAWLLDLEHEPGPEEFPTWESCRLRWTEDMAGDEEIGYCSCGLDSWRNQLFRFEAQPYAGREGWRSEWKI